MKCPHLLVMRQLGIHRVHSRLHLFGLSRCRSRSPKDIRARFPPAPPAALPANFCAIASSIGSGAMLCPDPRYDQILDAARNPPVSGRVHFALIAGMKPSIAQSLCRFLRAIPVSRKNIRPAHARSHHSRPASSRCPESPAPRARLNLVRIIHGTDRGGLGETVNLQHRNAQHHEIKLRLRRQRRRTANQRPQISRQSSSFGWWERPADWPVVSHIASPAFG